jgi:hypothetical protein
VRRDWRSWEMSLIKLASREMPELGIPEGGFFDIITSIQMS